MADDLFKSVGESVKKTIDGRESVVGGSVLGAAAGMLLPGGPLVWGVAGGVAAAVKQQKKAQEKQGGTTDTQ